MIQDGLIEVRRPNGRTRTFALPPVSSGAVVTVSSWGAVRGALECREAGVLPIYGAGDGK